MTVALVGSEVPAKPVVDLLRVRDVISLGHCGTFDRVGKKRLVREIQPVAEGEELVDRRRTAAAQDAQHRLRVDADLPTEDRRCDVSRGRVRAKHKR